MMQNRLSTCLQIAGKVILLKETELRRVFTCLLARGHLFVKV